MTARTLIKQKEYHRDGKHNFWLQVACPRVLAASGYRGAGKLTEPRYPALGPPFWPSQYTFKRTELD